MYLVQMSLGQIYRLWKLAADGGWITTLARMSMIVSPLRRGRCVITPDSMGASRGNTTSG
jgi:hypothetical protein